MNATTKNILHDGVPSSFGAAPTRPVPPTTASVMLGLGLCLATLGTGGCGNIDDTDIKNVSIGEVTTALAAREKNPMALALVDARAPQDFATGHIPGAVNLLIVDFPEQRERDRRFDAFDRIIVYGKDPSSPSARGLTKRMMYLGYDDVKFFPGGLNEWVGTGRPLETPEAKKTPDAKR